MVAFVPVLGRSSQQFRWIIIKNRIVNIWRNAIKLGAEQFNENCVETNIEYNYRRVMYKYFLGFFLKKDIDRSRILVGNLPLEFIISPSARSEVLSRVFQYAKRHFTGEESEICGFARDSLSRLGQGK